MRTGPLRMLEDEEEAGAERSRRLNKASGCPFFRQHIEPLVYMLILLVVMAVSYFYCPWVIVGIVAVSAVVCCADPLFNVPLWLGLALLFWRFSTISGVTLVPSYGV